MTSRDIKSRAGKLWPQMLFLHVFLAAFLSFVVVLVRADPYWHALVVGSLLGGVALGLALCYLRAPFDLYVGLSGLVYSFTRLPNPDLSRAYQEALRPFGRRWCWLGVGVPLVFLAIAQVVPSMPARSEADKGPLTDRAAGVLFLVLVECVVVYGGGWAWQLLFVSRSARPNNHQDAGNVSARDPASPG